MAARNKPAGIRPLVYGMSKVKVRIEGLSVLPGQDLSNVNAKLFIHLRQPIGQNMIQITLYPLMGAFSFKNESYESIPEGVFRCKQMICEPQKKLAKHK
jgi:hypothetical protein